MEKLLRSNSSLMLHHLPRILNIIQVLNMMVYGILNNQPVLLIQAVGSIQKGIHLPSGDQLKRSFLKHLQTFVRVAYYFLLTLTALLVVFSNYFTDNALVVAGSLALLALVIRLLLKPVKTNYYKKQLKNTLGFIRSALHTRFSPIHYFQY